MDDLLVVLLLFLFTILGFHIAFILFRRSPGFWIKADYVWLAIAALGLIAATSEIRTLVAWREYRSEENRLKLYMKHIIPVVEEMADGFESKLNNKEYPVKEHGIPIYQDAIKWFRRLADALRADYQLKLWQAFREELAEYSINEPYKLHVTGTKKRAFQILDHLDRRVDELASLEPTLEPRHFEVGILATLPLMLSGALALRITKVTATLLGHCQNSNRSEKKIVGMVGLLHKPC